MPLQNVAEKLHFSTLSRRSQVVPSAFGRRTASLGIRSPCLTLTFNSNFPFLLVTEMSARTTPWLVRTGQFPRRYPDHEGGRRGMIRTSSAEVSSTPAIKRATFNGSDTFTRLSGPQPAVSSILPFASGEYIRS